MNKIIRIFILLLVLAITAVIVYFVVHEEDDQYAELGPEVLLGSECGFDYLSCCKTDPSCTFGQQCCTDPNDPARNYCADECTCGAEQEFCCEGNICNEGLACNWGNCEAWGGAGEICHPDDNSCGEGLACLSGVCVECGIEGNPCCPSGSACVDVDKGKLECRDEICVLCGFDGLKSCLLGDKCLPGYLYNNNACYQCGGFNQPCCNEAVGLGYDCDPTKGLLCDLGFCRGE